jgi:predicted phosphate transport protein (TIGR00153 family)
LSLFRRAPDARLYDLLEESGVNVERTGELLREMLGAFPDGREDLGREILKCEQEGDRIAHDIIYRLHDRGVRSPMARNELYSLVSALDDVVDYAEQTADSLGLYGVEAPMEQAEAIAGVLVAAAEEVAVSLRGLRNGLEVGHQLREIHRLENEADRLQRAAVADLFATGIDPMIVIRWKDIFETLECAVDACERVANVVEGITLKRSNGRH